MNKRVLFAVLAIVAMAAFTSSAMATTIAVGNGSFQSDIVPDGGTFGYGAAAPAAGWQLVYGANTVETYNPTTADFTSAAGNGNLPAPALGSQALFNAATWDNDVCMLTKPSGTPHTAMTLDTGEWYTFTIAVGQGNSLHGAGWYGGYSLEVADLTAGSNLFNQEFHRVGTTGADLLPGQIDTPAPGTFQDFGIIFPADKYIDNDVFNDGDTLRVGIVFGMAGYIDNVRVTKWDTEAEAIAAESATGIYIEETITPPPAIPEPSTLALLATGLVGLLAYAWRKRK